MMYDVRCMMDNGQWRMDNGEWTMAEHFFFLNNELYELNEFTFASWQCEDRAIGQEIIRIIREIRCLIKHLDNGQWRM